MNRQTLLLFVLALCANPCSAQLHWSKINRHIPEDFDTLDGGYVRGDLNNDGLPDVVLALHNPEAEAKNPDVYRLVLVLFQTQKGFVVGGSSRDALYRSKDGGGGRGDAWAGIQISRGVLTVEHYGGGGAWKWVDKQKYRYQRDGFYKIGTTSDGFHGLTECSDGIGGAGREYKDVNLLTGDVEFLKTDLECNVLQHTRRREKKKPLQRM